MNKEELNKLNENIRALKTLYKKQGIKNWSQKIQDELGVSRDKVWRADKVGRDSNKILNKVCPKAATHSKDGRVRRPKVISDNVLEFYANILREFNINVPELPSEEARRINSISDNLFFLKKRKHFGAN